MTSTIFVFGSNLAGRHGKGAALYARQHHGAIYGQGIGLQGDSYAIPTKDEHIRTLPLDVIRHHVEDFKRFAAEHPETTFQVTAIGCGLAGYKPEQIGPMFADAPANCQLPDEFIPFAAKKANHPTSCPWGHPDTTTEIAPGIVLYSTPSHGGFWLSDARVATMPKPLRDFIPFGGPQPGPGRFYEEDCDWSVVALAFPQFFPEDAIPMAMKTLERYKPELYEQVVAAGIGQGRRL